MHPSHDGDINYMFARASQQCSLFCVLLDLLYKLH